MLCWSTCGHSHFYHFLVIIIIVFTLESTNLPFDLHRFRKQMAMYVEPMVSHYQYNATDQISGSRALYLNERWKRGANSSAVIKAHRPVHEIVVTIPDIVSDNKAKYIIQGDDAFITCADHPHLGATLQERSHYVWSNQLGNAISGERYHHFSNGTLFLSNAQAEDSGWYSCQAIHASVLVGEIKGETYHHRITVYSAPMFGFPLKWDYRISSCVKQTEIEYIDWIYGHLVKDVCNGLACKISNISVKCENGKMPPPPKKLRVRMYLSSTVPSSAHCDIACVEIAQADAVTKALKRLKRKLDVNLKTGLPSSDGILLFLPPSFSSQFEMTCSPGYELKFKVCTACEVGTISTASLPMCSPCDTGFFANKAGLSACLQCPIGTTTFEFGASNEMQCTGVNWQAYLPYVIVCFCSLLIGVFGGLIACKIHKRQKVKKIDNEEEYEGIDEEEEYEGIDEEEEYEGIDDESGNISEEEDFQYGDEATDEEESIEADELEEEEDEGDEEEEELEGEGDEAEKEEGEEEEVEKGIDVEEVEKEVDAEEEVEKKLEETEGEKNTTAPDDGSKETQPNVETSMANEEEIVEDANASTVENSKSSTPRSKTPMPKEKSSELNNDQSDANSSPSQWIKGPLSSKSPNKLRNENLQVNKAQAGKRIQRKMEPVTKLLSIVKEKKTQKVLDNEILSLK